MRTVYHVVVFLHVLAAVVWLGGMLGLAVLAPELRRAGDPATRQRLFQQVGRRFRTVGWACIAVLLGTGLAQLAFRGWWGWDAWGSLAFWTSDTGQTLAWKLGAVAVMLAIQAVHDFRHGPRAGTLDPRSPEAAAMRRRASWLARLNAVVGVAVIWFAVALVRGF